MATKKVKKPVKSTKPVKLKKQSLPKKVETPVMNTQVNTPTTTPTTTVDQVKVSSDSLKEIQTINESVNQLKLELGNLVLNARVAENNYLNKIQETQAALQDKVKELAVANNVDLEKQRWNFDLVTGVFTKK